MLEWRNPDRPKLAGVKPHTMRSTCFRYRLDKSWRNGRLTYFAWAYGLADDPERLGEFPSAEAAKAACESHRSQLRGVTHVAA